MHTYNPHEDEHRDYNNPQILRHRVQHKLLLQTEFKFIKQSTLEFKRSEK
jgi:hypothetical protein